MARITGGGRFTADFRVAATDEPSFAAPARYQLGMQCLFLRSGTEADRVDRLHARRYTFAALAPQEIDLLELVGPRIRLLQLKIAGEADAAAWLRLGGAATASWAEIGNLTVRPGTSKNPGGLVLAAAGTGLPVTPESRMLRLTPSSHDFAVDLLILGASV